MPRAPGAGVDLDHDYLSTACLHGRHDYCACDVGIVGAKKPNTCKWCDARCRCTCHDTGEEYRVSLSEVVKGRHPGVAAIARYFDYSHLPGHLQQVSEPCAHLAAQMISLLPDGPELTAGLRKLLEAKDCFVRQGLDQ